MTCKNKKIPSINAIFIINTNKPASILVLRKLIFLKELGGTCQEKRKTALKMWGFLIAFLGKITDFFFTKHIGKYVIIKNN